MTKQQQHRIPLAVIIGLVVVLVAAGGYVVWRSSGVPGAGGGGTVPLDDETEVDLRPHFSATRVVGRHQGERQFELDAGRIGDDDDAVNIEQIKNGVLYRDGEVFVTFEAAAGRWERTSNNLTLIGDVVLVYDERVHMETERLLWHAADEIVTAPDLVRMTIDGDVVLSDEMEADLDEERVLLQGNVRITRPTGDRVTMERIVYWLAEERLEGFGRGRLVFGAEDEQQ